MASADCENAAPMAGLLSELADTISRLERQLTDPAALAGVEDDLRRLLTALERARQLEPVGLDQAEMLKQLIARHEKLNLELARRLATMADFGSYLNQSVNN